jgi:glycosyltransferase involved in cell wall biosynthesis
MIIVDSLVTKNDLIQFYHLSPERIRVIYLGVDDSFRSLSSMEISQFLTENKLTQPYLLYIGQWRPHKGIIEAVKAFELVKKKLPQLKLVIGGKPNPDFPDITQIIEDSSVKKDIILPGFIADKDLVDYYNGAMAFLFPSFYEGFGLPPLEAMACGTPVIASNRSCLPEILGQAADLIDPKKTNQFAQAIINMVNDQARQEHFRQLGFRQAKQYSWKKMAEETLAVYRSIFATKGK